MPEDDGVMDYATACYIRDTTRPSDPRHGQAQRRINRLLAEMAARSVSSEPAATTATFAVVRDPDASVIEAMARASFAVEYGNSDDRKYAPNGWARHLRMNRAALAAYRAEQVAL